MGGVVVDDLPGGVGSGQGTVAAVKVQACFLEEDGVGGGCEVPDVTQHSFPAGLAVVVLGVGGAGGYIVGGYIEGGDGRADPLVRWKGSGVWWQAGELGGEEVGDGRLGGEGVGYCQVGEALRFFTDVSSVVEFFGVMDVIGVIGVVIVGVGARVRVLV